MEPVTHQQTAVERKQRPGFRDVGELILKIVIGLIVVAWFVRQYLAERQLDCASAILLALLVLLIIWLILRQRHVVMLRCRLTAPVGCVHGDASILPGKILEPVVGSAWGFGFSHYLLEVRDPGGDLLPGVVLYPDSGGNPDPAATQGNHAVNPGTLGWVDLAQAAADAGIDLLTSTTFTITLRVFGVDGSELSPPCQTTYQLSIYEAYIQRVSTPWSVNFADPDEPLRAGNNAASELATVGGNLHVRGAANVFGCGGEKIREYTLWAIPDPTFSEPQPPPLTSVTPGVTWVQLTHIEFGPQTIDGNNFTADQVRALNELDGNPVPDVLTNAWGVGLECHCVLFPTPVCSCVKVPRLWPKAVASHSALGTGKFTFLLQVIDTLGNAFYDVQRVWVDNEPIEAAIEGIAGLAPCTDLYTKDAGGAFRTVDVEGTAWDELIVAGDLTQPTSDNFDRFELSFQKQGASGEVPLVNSNLPVPARPNPVGVDVLGQWDLQWLDAATNPQGLAADQLLAPGEACSYDLILRVWDKTVVNESTVHHSGKLTFPIKVINAQP